MKSFFNQGCLYLILERSFFLSICFVWLLKR